MISEDKLFINNDERFLRTRDFVSDTELALLETLLQNQGGLLRISQIQEYLLEKNIRITRSNVCRLCNKLENLFGLLARSRKSKNIQDGIFYHVSVDALELAKKSNAARHERDKMQKAKRERMRKRAERHKALGIGHWRKKEKEQQMTQGTSPDHNNEYMVQHPRIQQCLNEDQNNSIESNTSRQSNGPTAFGALVGQTISTVFKRSNNNARSSSCCGIVYKDINQINQANVDFLEKEKCEKSPSSLDGSNSKKQSCAGSYRDGKLYSCAQAHTDPTETPASYCKHKWDNLHCERTECRNVSDLKANLEKSNQDKNLVRKCFNIYMRKFKDSGVINLTKRLARLIGAAIKRKFKTVENWSIYVDYMVKFPKSVKSEIKLLVHILIFKTINKYFSTLFQVFDKDGNIVDDFVYDLSEYTVIPIKDLCNKVWLPNRDELDRMKAGLDKDKKSKKKENKEEDDTQDKTEELDPEVLKANVRKKMWDDACQRMRNIDSEIQSCEENIKEEKNKRYPDTCSIDFFEERIKKMKEDRKHIAYSCNLT